eukprot:CAMPEP_0202901024 /NCGR_PEP_ID=MMETSP1392-20130828/12742_1 /ASSEMBLY_ACC=CAM_ASM_000868 /TAXON_ID=225041 /ORGANISM="Chlamydomonas chlamydogama, Strain SAG 11-48b" /LENGTH=273 /DNA_ID=CAMNT_0049587507 /DNA_START=202 /DNA_END=1023 /DNA_ORIENTATION=-
MNNSISSLLETGIQLFGVKGEDTLSRDETVVRERHQEQARLLKKHLTRLNQQAWKENILQLASFGGVIAAATTGLLSPTGPGGCDHNPLERCANCATSVPYVLCGVHAMKNRKTRAGRLWGASLVGVGAASCAFHASSGSIRPACRKLDFWSIAASSNIMLRSVFPGLPTAVTALGMLATPFKPFLVSTINSTAMELKYLYRAHKNPKLKGAQMLHATTCLVGLSCFALEEFFPRAPLIHSAWHIFSATAVGTVNHLIADVEENEMAITPLTV